MENEDKIAAAIEQAGTGNRNGHTLLGVGYCSRQGDQSFRGTPEEIEESRRQLREISTLIAISVSSSITSTDFPARGNYCTKLLTLQSKLLTSLSSCGSWSVIYMPGAHLSLDVRLLVQNEIQ
jgi:hypothetical protein